MGKKNSSRVLLKIGKTTRRFLWFEQREDGDFFLGFDRKSTIVKAGSFEIKAGTTQHRVNYNDLPFLEKTLKPGKISFHPSGQTHFKDADENYVFLFFRERLLKTAKV